MIKDKTIENKLHYGCTIFLNFKDTKDNLYYAYSEGFNSFHVTLRPDEYFTKERKFEGGLFRILPEFEGNEYKKLKSKQEDITAAYSEMQRDINIRGNS